ncbi:MAG: HD domain-containing protein, partial [Polyangiaceae bacterium]|nr:HD domain-containing protein [Polyangiaceae bacterium]
DRLTFDRQEEIASRLGYGVGAEAAERFMSEHYLYATRITHARELIVGRAMEHPRSRRPRTAEVAPGMQLFDDKLVFTSSGALARNPSLALRIFHQAVRLNVPIHPTSREAIRRACNLPNFRQSVRDTPQADELFLSLCTVVENTKLWRDSVLGDMHDVGMLAAMVPEFEPLVARVHHDVYHVLTVDVHSIAAVDKLRALARGDDPNDSPLLRRLATEMARPRVLFLAVLLHDVGKAIGRSDHSARGAPIAYDVARRCGLDEDDAAAVRNLVRHHLLMYHTATRRDVDDPQVAHEVAQVVGGRESLRELLLLTYVDVSTTSPDAMTAWKVALLEQLYLVVDAHLGQDGVVGRRERDDYVKSRLDAIANALGVEQDVRGFLMSMPERYVLGTDPGRVIMHAQLVRDRAPGQVGVAFLPAPRGAQAEVGIVADDQPGLLATLAAALAANRFSVLEAQIYSRQREDGAVEALDLFYVRGSSGTGGDGLERAAHKLERDLRDVLSGRTTADELVGPRMQALANERPTPHVRTEVVVDNRASTNLTVIEAFTQDRPALLYTLARTFRDLGLSIQLAKINTEGTKVADVFYVCEPDGAKVRSGERAETIRAQLVNALRRPVKEGS